MPTGAFSNRSSSAPLVPEQAAARPPRAPRTGRSACRADPPRRAPPPAARPRRAGTPRRRRRAGRRRGSGPPAPPGRRRLAKAVAPGRVRALRDARDEEGPAAHPGLAGIPHAAGEGHLAASRPRAWGRPGRLGSRTRCTGGGPVRLAFEHGARVGAERRPDRAQELGGRLAQVPGRAEDVGDLVARPDQPLQTLPGRAGDGGLGRGGHGPKGRRACGDRL